MPEIVHKQSFIRRGLGLFPQSFQFLFTLSEECYE